MPLSLAAKTLARTFKGEIDTFTRSAGGVVRPASRHPKHAVREACE
ncbi:hypothetical protein HT746_17215 [Burkholderia pyrrocinia]|nr:hypothetical protein [Burkholderia pyrrocinia]NTX28852.1 hypothetical protein [Burkholderia pyrrocinia]